MDKLERELANQLQNIPGGGGEAGAYGIRMNADNAAKIVRQMIEQAVKDALAK